MPDQLGRRRIQALLTSRGIASKTLLYSGQSNFLSKIGPTLRANEAGNWVSVDQRLDYPASAQFWLCSEGCVTRDPRFSPESRCCAVRKACNNVRPKAAGSRGQDDVPSGTASCVVNPLASQSVNDCTASFAPLIARRSAVGPSAASPRFHGNTDETLHARSRGRERLLDPWSDSISDSMAASHARRLRLDTQWPKSATFSSAIAHWHISTCSS